MCLICECCILPIGWNDILPAVPSITWSRIISWPFSWSQKLPQTSQLSGRDHPKTTLGVQWRQFSQVLLPIETFWECVDELSFEFSRVELKIVFQTLSENKDIFGNWKGYHLTLRALPPVFTQVPLTISLLLSWRSIFSPVHRRWFVCCRFRTCSPFS